MQVQKKIYRKMYAILNNWKTADPIETRLSLDKRAIRVENKTN